ncbi:hypothetical protein N0V93_000840 [Gnomoniopsis smithogilvyi]|uniref:Uncharacterized protein n=1 Tax=Gnomoniopsis smithogilvyi TaxID=1191159 RepID=A0A9W9D1Q2_9PEZI|nr:hypothetical protein N0V93_000840 [Gnomoniopsis smithogilvyi]
METYPQLSLELICMILMQVMLEDPPRILHLRRKHNRKTGLDDIAFNGNMDITQPLATRLSPWFRNWARKYYVLVFASNTRIQGYTSGGLWIRRNMDLIYIDNAFCAARLYTISSVSFANVLQIAVDATLLNDTTCRGFFVSLMDELLAYFRNVENMVFMVPTRYNPPGNRYRGLRLVDEEEEAHQKHLPFARFYHCGSIVTNLSHTTIMIARSPNAIRGSLIRSRLNVCDRLKDILVSGSPLKVILFQRQGMYAPVDNIVTGPKRSINNALSMIAARMRPVHISESELLALVEESMTKARPLGAQIQPLNLRPSQIRNRIW